MLAVLFSPRVRHSPEWRAVVTPLASIIGSGFLVVVPLLGAAVGTHALAAIVVILAVAYGAGAVIRFNIRVVEPMLEEGNAPTRVLVLERLGDATLSVAYVISVAFYLRLLAAFVLRAFDSTDPTTERILSTAILAGIGLVGFRRGLAGLELLESTAVSAKLSIIVALLLGLALHDLETMTVLPTATGNVTSPVEIFRILAGGLIMVQGFETARYLGNEYSPVARIEAMKRAQWISSGIYIVFVGLTTPLFPKLPSPVLETAMIDISGLISPILPTMLIFAAVMSQFSASVADTAGGGGLMAEISQRRLSTRNSYLLIALGAIALTWVSDIFQIIALASRAFALYYFIQCCVALAAASHSEQPVAMRVRVGFILMGSLLASVVLFAVPVE